MKMYLIDFEIDEVMTSFTDANKTELKQSLGSNLSKLLDAPILTDAYGNHLINNQVNTAYVSSGIKPIYIPDDIDKTRFEAAMNKVNLLDYMDGKSILNDHEAWAGTFLRNGLHFSLLLSDKLASIGSGQFKVIFTYGLSKHIDSIVRFHSIRENEIFIPDDFETQPFVQGIMTIDC